MNKGVTLIILALFLALLYSRRTNNRTGSALVQTKTLLPVNNQTELLATEYAFEKLCTGKGYGFDRENLKCTHTKETCEKANTWTLNEGGVYVVWDKSREACIYGPTIARNFCEENEFLQWDNENLRCKVTKEYCEGYGLDFLDDDCYIPPGQAWLEMTPLGETITRSIKLGIQGKSCIGKKKD